jgi:hypothetical protein
LFSALAYVHAQLLRLCLWLLKLPFKALWSSLLAVVALLGEEFRRWAGLAVAGLLIVGAGKATLQFAPAGARRPLVLTVLVLLVVWALAVRRAVRVTRRNNLVAVRQRQAFRELRGDVGQIRGRVTDGLARATRDTPFGGAFKGNREETAKAEARVAAEIRAAEAERMAAEAEQRVWDEQAAVGFDLEDVIPR